MPRYDLPGDREPSYSFPFAQASTPIREPELRLYAAPQPRLRLTRRGTAVLVTLIVALVTLAGFLGVVTASNAKVDGYCSSLTHAQAVRDGCK